MVQPNKWGEVLGYNADYNQLPEDATLTASFSKLFPEITQIPLEVGGTPPKRMDLNAIFKLIGENVFYYQNGGVFEYNDNFRYEAGNVIRFNNKIFLCIRENSRTNKHAPNDATYWQQITTNDILRNYVKSVNGITPDANGNVSFSYVKYTDLTPYAKRTELEPKVDRTEFIETLRRYVKSVNGITPDANGNVSFSYVKYSDLTPYATKSELTPKADRSELAPLATKSEVEIACPVGTVHAFAGVYAPNGWLLCNGQAVSRSQFSRLFSVISTRYGGGDGYSTFNVPDMRDRFIEGAHSYNVGTPLNAGIPNITGTTQTNDDTSAVGGAFRVERAFGTDRHALLYFQVVDEYQVSFDASRSSAVYGRSSTVQPNALNMNFIIKY
ncbi:MAG: phage tail protein [Succinivibrio dextrinosolvens]|nr:phage tail protein [Succinivibrio dextrinosolvens]